MRSRYVRESGNKSGNLQLVELKVLYLISHNRWFMFILSKVGYDIYGIYIIKKIYKHTQAFYR